jgi:hypothetical protein
MGCRHTAGSDTEVEIIIFEEKEIVPVAPEPPKNSLKEKRKKKRKKLAPPESEGHLVIWLKTTGSAPIVEAVEEEGRPGNGRNFGEPYT